MKRTSKRDTVLKAMMADQYRRAVLAFPDEDVLVGTRFLDASGFEAFKVLTDIVPRPEHTLSRRDVDDGTGWHRCRPSGAATSIIHLRVKTRYY